MCCAKWAWSATVRRTSSSSPGQVTLLPQVASGTRHPCGAGGNVEHEGTALDRGSPAGSPASSSEAKGRHGALERSMLTGGARAAPDPAGSAVRTTLYTIRLPLTGEDHSQIGRHA